MDTKCSCGLNFEELKTTVDVQILLDEKLLKDEGFKLQCPACKEEKLVELKPYGLFLWKDDNGHEKLFRWSSATTVLETTKVGQMIRLGQLTIIFPNDMVGESNFSEKQICYKSVPLFREKNGKIQSPNLPVQKKYLDMVDSEKEMSVNETGNGDYRFRFHLRIKDEAMEIVLPSIPVKFGKSVTSGSAQAFEDVHLVLWPKVNYRVWRRYFLRFGYAGETPEDFINDSREVCVWARASDDLDKKANDRKWLQLDTITPDKKTRLACVESRPDWVAIEFKDVQRNEIVGGGLWDIPSPKNDSFPSFSDSTSLGVDFGTSNTCIAWNTPRGPEMLQIESCNDFIIEGSDLPRELEYPDTWFPRQGFGRNHTLLPTELITHKKVSELRSHNRRVEEWKPVIDYSIPSSGVETKFQEREYVIADFKWQRMIQDQWLQGGYMELQKRYLELVLLNALAQLAKKAELGSQVSVKFSYPLAFDDNTQVKLSEVVKSVAQVVSKQTGVNVDSEISVDEARAASSKSERGVDDKACLYVDIGGGSTDIALLEFGTGIRGLNKYSHICSFQYAGSGLAFALTEGKCLKPGCDIAHFRREMREAGSVSELLNSHTLFAKDKIITITKKSGYFYAYLRQFLARLLAANIINNQISKGKIQGKNEENSVRETYTITLHALGNGWGFGHFLGSSFASGIFCKKLTADANIILDDAISNGTVPTHTPRIEVNGKTVDNPKDAVAEGLLNPPDSSVEKPDWSWRTIVGWTTRGEGGRQAEWFYPVTMGDYQAPEDASEMPVNSVLDCPPNVWPAFPQELPAPHELDSGLDKTRRHLTKCSPIAVDEKWFRYSPYHVLLEELFKPALKELI